MHTLREALAAAAEQKIALGHFNISDSTQLHAIVDVAQELELPVVLGVSEGERTFLGVPEVAALVASERAQGKAVYLNADHTHSVEGCKEAIDAGFDSVIIDCTKLTEDERIAQTREVVAYANASGRDVMIEGELGYIGTSSKLLDSIPEDVLAAALPSADDAQRFVEETGVTALAPAVGNVHGMLKNQPNPRLHIDLIAEIRAALPHTPLVLHGGSGIEDEDFTGAIKAGMNLVHINTEIRVAYRKGIEAGLAADADEIAPYRYLDHGRDQMKEVVRKRLALFAGKAA